MCQRCHRLCASHRAARLGVSAVAPAIQSSGQSHVPSSLLGCVSMLDSYFARQAANATKTARPPPTAAAAARRVQRVALMIVRAALAPWLGHGCEAGPCHLIEAPYFRSFRRLYVVIGDRNNRRIIEHCDKDQGKHREHKECLWVGVLGMNNVSQYECQYESIHMRTNSMSQGVDACIIDIMC